MARDFDSPWKEALSESLDLALEFLLPDLHQAIDWSAGYKDLDTELQQLIREGETGSRAGDKLFEVRLKTGDNIWILIHIEVQSQRDNELPERMFIYHYRIFDRYGRRIVSLAILGDESVDWRPSEYIEECFGTERRLRFRMVKLLDYADHIEDLEQATNPFGLFIIAHLQSLWTNDDPERRYEWKWRLLRGLYQRGFDAERLRKWLRVIDWILELPKELAQQLQYTIAEYEKEQTMPYVTSFERIAEERGMQKGLEEGREKGLEEGREKGLEEGSWRATLDSLKMILTFRFQEAGLAFLQELETMRNLEKTMRVRDASLSAQTLEELRELVK